MTVDEQGFAHAPITEQVDRLEVEAYRDRDAMGEAAAVRVAAWVRRAIERRGEARVVFASAPSQREFLAALARREVDWSRVIAFHMDEYMGLAGDSPRSFSWFLREHLFRFVSPREFHAIDGLADPVAEASRYAALLAAAPLDVVCCGIGENGHLAFNDPPEARFDDPQPLRHVAMSEVSRQQQVHDGMFPTLGTVPTHALTLTLPTLFSAGAMSCVVPGPTKREAVRRTLREPISEDCPASILRRHRRAVLHVDMDAYGK